MTPTNATCTSRTYAVGRAAIALTALGCLLLLTPGCSFLFGRQRYSSTTKNNRKDPGAEVRRAFHRAAYSRSRLLRALYHLSQPTIGRERYLSRQGVTRGTVNDGLAQLQTLPAFLAECPTYLKHPVETGSPWYQTRIACNLAGRASELLEAYYRDTLSKSLKSDVEEYHSLAEKIRRGDQVSGWRLEKWLYKKGASSQCSTYYAEIFAQLKKPCPAELLAPLRVARDRLLNAVRFASSNIRRRRLSGVSGLLRAAVRNRVERDGKFLAAGLTSGWTFERGRWGIFEKRHKRGIVVIKRPNEAFCRENGFVASQQYLGGLRWNREYNVGLRDDLRIIRCR